MVLLPRINWVSLDMDANTNKPIDIIIVKYGLPDYEQETVEQVMRTVGVPYHLSVYDNYPLDENLSVVWNRLIKRSNADFVLLLNNDTVPRGSWADKLLEAMSDPKVGAVGSISNKAGGHQGGWEKSPEDKVVECVMLSGFCVLIRKAAFDAIGGFNEAYKLYGEDSDFFRRMKKAGWTLLTHYGSYVYHHKAQSTKIAEARGKDVEAIKRESSALFQASL